MEKEMLEHIKNTARTTSIKTISDEEIEQIVKKTEARLGKTLTGYGLRDKPHQQFYSKESVMMVYENNEKVVCRVLRECDKYSERVAYIVGNKKITYRELKENIISTAKKLTDFGVKKDDKVTFSALSELQAIYIFFALNLIGAIPCPLDPIWSEENTIKSINETNTDFYITNDIKFLQQRKIASKTKLKKVLALPVDYVIEHKKTTESSFFKLLSKLSRLAIKISSNSKWETLSDFQMRKETDLDIETLVNDYNPETIMAILPTSGSTGEARGVCLNDSNFLLSIKKQEMSGFNIGDNEKMYNPMPTNSSYFWADIVLAIVHGATTILDPLFNADKFPKTLLETDATIALTGPILLEKLVTYIDSIDESLLKGSNLKHIISGGDILHLSLEQSVNERLKRINPSLKVENALGLSETIAQAFNPNGLLLDPEAYSEGSVGIVLPGDEYGIFQFDKENNIRNITNPEYNQGLTYYEIGEICFKATNPNVFKKYYNNEEATNASFITHTDGTVWFHTGDLGYMDPAGFQYCTGRKSGLIVRLGHKVWAPKIEKVFIEDSRIKEVKVIGVPDEKEKEIPVVFIVFDERIPEAEKDRIIVQLKEKIMKKLDELHIPKFVWEVEEIPRNAMKKAKIAELESIHNKRVENYKQKITDLPKRKVLVK